MVSGVGTDRGVPVQLRRIVTDLAVLDLGGPDGTMRLVSVHPGVTVEGVQAATGFPLHVDGVTETRLPTDEERDREVPPA
jgi:acyl CoA:acetate/3-ketoacid CoA transferase beta subunit